MARSLRLFSIILLLVGFIFFSSGIAQAVPVDWTITGSNSFTGVVGVAMPITDLQITESVNPTIPVKLLVTSGTLEMSETTGLTFTGDETGSVLYFSGSTADINAALATLTYTRGAAGTDTLEVSLVDPGEVFFTDNGHLYEYVSDTKTWSQAQTAAAARTAYGSTGYLTTITSEEENDFVAERLENAGWIGASDVTTEDTWKWVTGPESGTTFWQGDQGGAVVGDNYANWNTGEPNDSGNNEDCGQFLSGASGKWNDLPCTVTTLPGYVVEYGADGDLPNVIAKDIAITTLALPTVSTLSPADNATNINPASNLVITFTQAVTTSTGNILIKKTSDDSTVETIDVAGSQVTGGGTTSITINPATNLSDSTGYYITIPNTAFKNAGNGAYAGISNSTTWNFTTGDYTAPVLTTVTAIPSRPLLSQTTYYFTTSEACEIQVTAPTSDRGEVAVLAEEVEVGRNIGITLQGAEVGGTYSFSFQCVDDNDNESGFITVGPFRIINEPSGSTGSSVQTRVNNLFAIGKEDAANTLISEWPHLFTENKLAQDSSSQDSTITEVPVNLTPTPVRDLYITLTGEDVKKLQTLLITLDRGPMARELARIGATGYFGTYTRDALAEYQKLNNISPAQGYFGAITRAQMKRVDLRDLWW